MRTSQICARTMAAVLALALLAACGGDDEPDAATTTSTTTEQVTTTVVTLAPATPHPDAATAAQIEAEVAAIYPGVPEGKATDWAVAACRDILDGNPDELVVERTAARFAGGDRPDPTTEQAEAIVAVVRAASFCA